MKKAYFAPEVISTMVTTTEMIAQSMKLNGTTGNLSDPGNSLGKEGMTPVSEDNANSIWED
jgi:hypothetical protein